MKLGEIKQDTILANLKCPFCGGALKLKQQIDCYDSYHCHAHEGWAIYFWRSIVDTNLLVGLEDSRNRDAIPGVPPEIYAIFKFAFIGKSSEIDLYLSKENTYLNLKSRQSSDYKLCLAKIKKMLR